MVELMFRLLAEAGPGVAWVVGLLAAVAATFTLYVGLAMVATWRAHDPDQAAIRYRVFNDLLALFDRRRRR